MLLDTMEISGQHLQNAHDNLLEFVTQPNNQMAYNIAEQITATGYAKYNPIVFYGKKNSGKSHLLKAIARGLKKQSEEASIIYLRGDDLYRIYQSYLKEKKYRIFRNLHRSCDYFFLDDIHLLKNKVATQKELVFMLKELQIRGAHIIIGSPSLMKNLPGLSLLANQLSGGLCVSIAPLSSETIYNYAKERAAGHHVHVDKDAVFAIWQNYHGSFMEFKIALNRILQVLSQNRKSLTLQCIQTWLHSQHALDKAKVDEHVILEMVAEYFHLEDSGELKEKKGRRQLVTPRYIAISLLRNVMKMSIDDLQVFFGRSRSSIQDALSKVQKEENLLESYHFIHKKLMKRANRKLAC